MRHFLVFIIFFSLVLFPGCKSKEKEEIKITQASTTKKVQDTKLERWKKEIERKTFKINVNTLKNPFIPPEFLKFVQLKEKRIPLELVGILKQRNKMIALLQDDKKMGYIATEGTIIGNLKIVKIMPDHVIVEEETITIYGEKKKIKKILPLKKE